MKVRLTLAAVLSLLAASPALGQRVISRGMTPDQVRTVFGDPARTRDEGDWSYWFYANGCPVRCGSDDVVFFREQKVVAAVLRTRARRIAAPPAADALQQAGGSEDIDRLRPQAGTVQPQPPLARQRVIVNGRRRAANEPEQPPARVGRIHVESGGRTVIDRSTPGQVRDITRDSGTVAPPARSGSDEARNRANATPAGAGQTTIIRTPGAQTPVVGRPATAAPTGNAAPVQSDSLLGNSATETNDNRDAREKEITRTTVRNQPDTIQARQRNRERSVTPRVVPKP